MNKKYIVRLTEDERKQLKEVVAKGKAPAYTIKHAHILLKVDVDRDTWSDERIAQAFGCHTNTVRNVRQRFVEHGLATALERNKRNKVGRGKALDGKAEAHLLALGCSQPPQGHARWTLRLLADKMVALEYIESLSYETVRRSLKKMS
jgi:transposase